MVKPMVGFPVPCRVAAAAMLGIVTGSLPGSSAVAAMGFPRIAGPADLHATFGAVQVVATGPAARPKVSLAGFFTVENQGGATARASLTRLYASTDRTLDASDPLIGTLRVSAIAGGKYRVYRKLKLAPGQNPANLHGKYVIAVQDAAGQIAEQSEINNTAVSPLVP